MPLLEYFTTFVILNNFCVAFAIALQIFGRITVKEKKLGTESLVAFHMTGSHTAAEDKNQMSFCFLIHDRCFDTSVFTTS